MALLAGQPILIGILINLSQLRPTEIRSIFLFAVIACIWLGLNNTAREVVRERRIYVRERQVGVIPEGYLAAKICLYGTVGLVQIILLLVLLRYANFLQPSDARNLNAWSPLYLLIVLYTTYLAALILGLLVSTLANSQEVAVAALPLIVLPQLLLTGEVTGLIARNDGSFQPLLILVTKSSGASRTAMEQVLELVSLPTYSRPSLALLEKTRFDSDYLPPFAVALVDWLHLLMLLLVTATALVVVFRWRERRWLEEA